MLSEERKLYENRPPEGAKTARGGSKMVSGRPPDGSFVPVGPNLAAKAARKPSLGGSGGAPGALLAARGAVLKPLGPLLGRPGPLLGALGGGFGTSQGLIWTIWTMSVALREIQQKHCILQCFWASRASRRGPKSLQNRPGRPLGRLVGPKNGLEGTS